MLAPINDRFLDKQSVDFNILEFKKLSHKLNVTLFAISSFNRSSYESKVIMGNFKESGAIEFCSDVLMGLELYYEKQFDKNTKKLIEVGFEALKRVGRWEMLIGLYCINIPK